MLFVFSSLMVIAGGVSVATILDQHRRAHLGAHEALVWYLEIVVAGRLLGLFDLLGSRAGWMVADLLFFVTAMFVWRRAGLPRCSPRSPAEQWPTAGSSMAEGGTIGLALVAARSTSCCWLRLCGSHRTWTTC